MKHPDILVIGPGRCGTSFVAYILQTFFDVCMGVNSIGKSLGCFKREGPQEPLTKRTNVKHRWGGGAWEDRRLRVKTWELFEGKCSSEDWLESFNKAHAIHEPDLLISCSAKYTGFKHPTLLWLPKDFWEVVRPRIVVHCTREKLATLKSLRKWAQGVTINWDEKIWACYEYIWQHELVNIPGYVTIDFTNEVSTEEVMKILKPRLEG